MRVYQAVWVFTVLIVVIFSKAVQAKTMQQAPTHFVILLYHHVSDETPPVTSISPEMFANHLEYLSKNHNIVSLQQAMDALHNNQPLPDSSVVITFDDGYANIFENAYPLLSEYEFPFTIFINPDQIGALASQLSWDQITQMQPLATFANHTIAHLHLLDRAPNENAQQWLLRIMANINEAEKLLEDNLGYSKKWLAYPFGEYNNVLKTAILDAGYVGFAQHSGGVSNYSDLGAIPRFPAAGIYANLNTLKTKLKSIAMPVKNITPPDPVISKSTVVDRLVFEVESNEDIRIAQLACYYRGQLIGSRVDGWKVTVAIDREFPVGRSRINCTAPSNQQSGRFYWYSAPFFRADATGKFID